MESQINSALLILGTVSMLSNRVLCQKANCQQDIKIDHTNRTGYAPYLPYINVTEVVMATTGEFPRLKCCINGYPLPDITWLKNGGPLPIDYRLRFSPRKQILTIERVRTSDAGNYTCEGRNIWGNISHDIALEVQVASRVFKSFIFMPRKQWNATISTNITMICLIKSNKEPALVGWIHMKNGSAALPRGRHVQLRKSAEDKQWILSLTIVNVTLEDYGRYICRAQTGAGSGNATQAEGVLNVIRIPDKTRDIKAVTPPNPEQNYHMILGALGGVVFVAVIGIFAARWRYMRRSSRLPINDTFKDNEHHPFIHHEAEIHAEDLRERLELLAQAPPEGANAEFDVFISYSSLDRDIVMNVFYPEISSTHKVCIDFKDFEAGLFIQENIANAIFKSRKTVLIITRNFLSREGGWTYFELQIAQGRLQHGYDVLVPVIVEDIPVDELPVTLQHYRLRKTYLEWFNEDVRPHFWDRLRVALGPSIRQDAQEV